MKNDVFTILKEYYYVVNQLLNVLLVIDLYTYSNIERHR